MKKAFVLSTLMLALLMSAFAQGSGRQLSADDQRRFDSYFSRYQQYQQNNNRGEVRSMESRMQDIYRHYSIPSRTPYARVASSGGGDVRWAGDRDGDRGRGRDYDWDWNRNRDRDWNQQDRDWDRGQRADWERNRDQHRGDWTQNQSLSASDQGRFDSYFQRWMNYRQTNNRDEIVSMEKRMFDVYDHYGIPHNTPFDRVASRGY